MTSTPPPRPVPEPPHRRLPAETEARRIVVRGVVQGVGFRPLVFRCATELQITGWVRNDSDGVVIHVEGRAEKLDDFVGTLEYRLPAAAQVTDIDVKQVPVTGCAAFTIEMSTPDASPTTHLSVDLPICDSCRHELLDDNDRRYGYPYINCTQCGPRYTIIHGLPYDRARTTIDPWPMCGDCTREFNDPSNRRFHAQPTACPKCGPTYFLLKPERSGSTVKCADDLPAAAARRGVPQGAAPDVADLGHASGSKVHGHNAFDEAAALLRLGAIVAVKGLGGYHLVCDARNASAVAALRERKYRKEKAFALMVRDLETAESLIHLDDAGRKILGSAARPIVIERAKQELTGVAPDSGEMGVMLPHSPVHCLLFALGAPEILVMTSGNRSNEPLAFDDEDALSRLSGIADAFLVGERAIVRRVDDSVVRIGPLGGIILRRARGYAPSAVAALPSARPILAVGADLKNTVTLVVDGQAFVSQHVGDLGQHGSLVAFRSTIEDLLAMWKINADDLAVAHDLHPDYASTAFAYELSDRRIAVQHHRAHIASVLAERGEWNRRIVGVAFDGTGYGDNHDIWGGEIFTGSVLAGFRRVAHLKPAILPGGDAAARFPAQAAAGFLSQMDGIPDMSRPPFCLPPRYERSRRLVKRGIRSFATTSVGRLFDTASAITGFNRETSFEGQAAMWFEQCAARSITARAYPFPELDFEPLLHALIKDVAASRSPFDAARAFHRGVATGLFSVCKDICDGESIDTIVLSGGVFQNRIVLADLKELAEQSGTVQVWTNRKVPPNDGGISLGQAAIAAFALEHGDL